MAGEKLDIQFFADQSTGTKEGVGRAAVPCWHLQTVVNLLWNREGPMIQHCAQHFHF